MPKNRTPAVIQREVTGPRSLMRLLGLFDALAKSPKDGLGLAELNTVLNSPKSSLLNLLRPLVSTGYLNLESGRYRLGPSIFRLAGTIMSVWNFSNTVRPFLEELAVRSRESVYLGVLDRIGKVITYVDAIDSPHSVRYSVPIGAVRVVGVERYKGKIRVSFHAARRCHRLGPLTCFGANRRRLSK